MSWFFGRPPASLKLRRVTPAPSPGMRPCFRMLLPLGACRPTPGPHLCGGKGKGTDHATRDYHCCPGLQLLALICRARSISRRRFRRRRGRRRCDRRRCRWRAGRRSYRRRRYRRCGDDGGWRHGDFAGSGHLQSGDVGSRPPGHHGNYGWRPHRDGWNWEWHRWQRAGRNHLGRCRDGYGRNWRHQWSKHEHRCHDWSRHGGYGGWLDRDQWRWFDGGRHG